MLQRIFVDNYRCLVDFECHLAAKQLLLGSNGSGKSTLFDVLSVLRDFCIRGESADDRLVGHTRTRWVKDDATQVFELDVLGSAGKYRFRLVVDEWGSPARPRVVTEEVYFDDKPIFQFAKAEVHLFNDRHEDKVQYPFDWHRSALATIAERKDNSKLTWFKRWLGGLYHVNPDPRRMTPVASRETACPASDLSNFADWYRHLRLESDDAELQADLRDAIGGFVSVDLPEAGLGNRVLRLRLTLDENGDGKTTPYWFYNFDELSDGQRVLVGLYAVLHFALKNEATICFDEPDNFIALRELQPWLTKVLNRVDDNVGAQVLIASHHPELLNRMAFQDGLLLDRPDGGGVRVRRFDDSDKTGLSPAEIVARGWERE